MELDQPQSLAELKIKHMGNTFDEYGKIQKIKYTKKYETLVEISKYNKILKRDKVCKY